MEGCYGSVTLRPTQPPPVWRPGRRLSNACASTTTSMDKISRSNGDLATATWTASPGLATELVHLRVDVIVATTAGAALFVKNATSTIPIVFVSVPDPVADGLVKSLARPGGNATGLTAVQTELAPKRLAILKEVLPGLRKIGVLRAPVLLSEAGTAEVIRLVGAAKPLSVELHIEEVSGPERFDDVFAVMKGRQVGAMILIPHPLFYSHRERLVMLSTQNRLPLMAWVREFTEIGAPLAYGVRNIDMLRRAADYVARILKGEKPADLPVEQPTKFELTINLKTAKALGLTIPPSLLLRADQVIE
jgi:putative tryptophan/tyrosine transport system substrate-binding protein